MSCCAGRPVARSVSQRSVESLSSPLSLVSESLSLPESEESLSSPLSLPESEESASSPLSPSLTVAPPWARTSGQMVLICSSWSWVVSTPMARPPLETTSLQVIPQQASYDTLRPPQRPSPIASQTAETDAIPPHCPQRRATNCGQPAAALAACRWLGQRAFVAAQVGLGEDPDQPVALLHDQQAVQL